MLDAVRDTLFRSLTSPAGDAYLPIRLPKDLARRVNMVLGSPLATKEELARRRAAAARLATLRTVKSETVRKVEAAPVMIYMEKDRNARELGRIREVLEAKKIAFTLLDVAGDEATHDFVLRESKLEADDLPAVFIAGKCVGTFRDLVELDVSGGLEKQVFGG